MRLACLGVMGAGTNITTYISVTKENDRSYSIFIRYGEATSLPNQLARPATHVSSLRSTVLLFVGLDNGDMRRLLIKKNVITKCLAI